MKCPNWWDVHLGLYRVYLNSRFAPPVFVKVDSTIDLIGIITLYEAWNKPEIAKKWQAKLLQTEAVDEWHNALKMAQFSIAKSIQLDYNYTTSYLPISQKSPLVSVLITIAYEKVKICHRIQWPLYLYSVTWVYGSNVRCALHAHYLKITCKNARK